MPAPTEVGYIAYIDESGDDGLAHVQPIDPRGASEWFVLSAVVIKAEREPEVVPWVKDILLRLRQHQRRDLHFRHLSEEKKAIVCAAIAALPVRCFVVACNKRNMRSYHNERAAKVPAKNWFYCWVTRLLLERVTGYCYRRSMDNHGRPLAVRMEFSRRGGMSYPQLRAYLHYLRFRSTSDQLVLKKGDLVWPVVNEDELHAYDHKTRAGLQLADPIASAFYQSVAPSADGTCVPRHAIALAPRMCADAKGRVFDYGVKVMPWDWGFRLPPASRSAFEFYRTQDKKVAAPGP